MFFDRQTICQSLSLYLGHTLKDKCWVDLGNIFQGKCLSKQQLVWSK